MGTEKGVARVRRDLLAGPLTCPLCKDLFREASAFVGCLHTFCRECIMKKIEEEEIDSCPVCHTDLGITPEEKLRPDPNIQNLRNKLFPPKIEVDASKVPTITSPAKRKERSLSSLVVETPKKIIQTSLTGQRTKPARRTTSHLASLINNGTMKLLNNSEGRDQKTEKTSAPQSTKMTTSADKTQITADIVASNQPSSEDVENRETIDNEELQKPLHSLVSGKRSLRLSLKRQLKSQNAAVKEDKIKSTKGELSIRKDAAADKVAITGIRVCGHSNKLKLLDKNNGNSSESVSSTDKRSTKDSLRKSAEEDSQGKALNSLVEASKKLSLGSSPKSRGTAANEDRIKSTNGKLSIRKDDTVDKLATAEYPSEKLSLGSIPKSHGTAAKEDRIKSTNGKLSVRKDDTVDKLATAEYPSEKLSLGSSPKSLGTAAKEDRIKSTNGKLSIRKDDTEDKLVTAELRVSADPNKTTTEDNLRKSPEADSRQEQVGSTSTGSLEAGITTPVWFSLVTSPNQAEAKLPQIPKAFFRIKNGTMKVSSILNLITRKLELASDDKLEILCNEWPICPSTTLHRLLQQWLSRKPKHEVRATVGDPAKEFVMELFYRRRPADVSLCCMMKTNSVATSLPCYCSTST